MSDQQRPKEISWEEFVKLATELRRDEARAEQSLPEPHVQRHVEVHHDVEPQGTQRVEFRGLGRPGVHKRVRRASNAAQASLHTIRSIGRMQQEQRDIEELQRRNQHLERRRVHSAHFLSAQEMNIVEQALNAGKRPRKSPSDPSKAAAAAELKTKSRAEREGKHMYKVCEHYFGLRACCFYDVPEEMLSVQDVYQAHHQLDTLRTTRDRYQWLLDMLRLMPENGFHAARRPCCKNCFKAFYGISVSNTPIVVYMIG